MEYRIGDDVKKVKLTDTEGREKMVGVGELVCDSFISVGIALLLTFKFYNK
jgi:hypothetical protein